MTHTGMIFTATLSGNRYVCTMVGGWEMFQVPPNQVTWMQARAALFSSAREPFEPQLSATTDYEFRIPPPPDPGPDPGLLEVWDQGLWGPTPTSNPPSPADKEAYAQWDQPGAGSPADQEYDVGVDRRDRLFACANRAGERGAAGPDPTSNLFRWRQPSCAWQQTCENPMEEWSRKLKLLHWMMIERADGVSPLICFDDDGGDGGDGGDGAEGGDGGDGGDG